MIDKGPQSIYCLTCGAANVASNSTCFTCQHPLNPSLAQASPLLQQRYRLLTQVGSGGFGAVYKARDLQAAGDCPEIVAIKQVHLRGLTPQEVIEATETFHREIPLLSQLKHDHLPRIYDHFTDPEHWYLVIDFIEGETLEDYLHSGIAASSTTTRILPLDEVLLIAIQLCDVLSYLHTRQPPIIFRDLKPSNIMRTPKGRLFLIDFGIARQFKPGQLRDTSPLGSPGYAAPEQYGKYQTSPQSDLYSLGALLHQLLTGNDPCETPLQFAPLSHSGSTRLHHMDDLLARLVALDREKRPQSAVQVKKELLHLKDSDREERIWLPTTPQEPPPSRLPFSLTQAPTKPPFLPQQLPLSPQQPQQIPLKRRKVITLGLVLAAGVVGVGAGIERLAHQSQPPSTPLFTTTPHSLIYHGHTATVLSIAWSPAGSSIASVGVDHTLQVWPALGGQRLYFLDGQPLHAVTWAPGRLLAYNTILEGMTVLNFCSPFSSSPSQNYAFNMKGDVISLAWSPVAPQMAIGGSDGVQIIDANNGTILFEKAKPRSAVLSLAWSPDGRSLAWGQEDLGTVEVWDVATNHQLFTFLEGEYGRRVAVAWSPDGQHLAFAFEGGPLRVYHTATWRLAYTLPEDNRPYALAWSPDSRSLAWAGIGQNVKIWNTQTKKQSFTYTGPTFDVEALA